MTIPAVYIITIGVVVGFAIFAFFASQPQHRPHSSAPPPPSNKSSDSDFVDDSTRCTICLEEIKSDKTYLDCGHSFHRYCVVKWLNMKETCPNCNKVHRKAV